MILMSELAFHQAFDIHCCQGGLFIIFTPLLYLHQASLFLLLSTN